MVGGVSDNLAPVLRRSLTAALLLTALALVPAGPAAAQTIAVDAFADSFDGSCTDGDCSLRDAIASAGGGDLIEVPSGFYPLTLIEAGGGAGDGSLEVMTDVELRGVGETGVFIDGSALGAPVFHVREPGNLALDDVTIFGADTDVGGPALWVVGGNASMRHVTITGGRGERSGAVVLDQGATLGVVGSLFLENRSSAGAGAIWTGRNGGGVAVRDSAFVDNRGARGGAIDGRIMRLADTTLWGNVARTRGGAIWPVIRLRMVNVTIAANRADRGAAIAIPQRENVPSRAHLTVIAGNRSRSGGACSGLDLLSAGRNVSDDAGCGLTGASDRVADPRLRSIGSYGGPTPTAALGRGSPALDIGGGCTPTDQRGAPRSGACDAGAYERVLCRGRAVDIVGTPGDDEFSGGREDDTFLGLGGDDELQGSLGRDHACAGGGNDHVLGGPGNDVLRGGRGADQLDGEDGVDRCVGGPGRDELIACE
jgi:CSLREA domain-containing protein